MIMAADTAQVLQGTSRGGFICIQCFDRAWSWRRSLPWGIALIRVSHPWQHPTTLPQGLQGLALGLLQHLRARVVTQGYVRVYSPRRTRQQTFAAPPTQAHACHMCHTCQMQKPHMDSTVCVHELGEHRRDRHQRRHVHDPHQRLPVTMKVISY